MKVAILYLLTGIGHYRESYSIGIELAKAGHKITYIEMLEGLKNFPSFKTRFWSQLYHFLINQIALKAMTKPTRIFHTKINYTCDFKYYFSRFVIFNLLDFLSRMLGRSIGNLYQFEQYDLIISLHPITTSAARSYLHMQKLKTPLLNVIPDETGVLAGDFYRADGLLNLVNSKAMHVCLNSCGLPEKNLKVIGHPLDPRILEKRKEIQKRVYNDLYKQKFTIGIYMGLFCPRSQIEDNINILTELAPQIKADKVKVKVISCGHDEYKHDVDDVIQRLELEKYIDKQYVSSPKELVVVGHEWMMKDVNLIVSRPSELVFYSLATGIPHLLSSPHGPQEVDMYCLLQSQAPVKYYSEIKNTLWEYLNDRDSLLKIHEGFVKTDYNFSGALNVKNYLDELQNRSTSRS